MSNLEDFKDIADNLLKDVQMSNRLKEKTLSRCKRNLIFTNNRILAASLVMAAVLTLIIMNSNLSYFKRENQSGNNTVMMESTGKTTSGPGKNNTVADPNQTVSNTGEPVTILKGPSETKAGQSTNPSTGTGTPIYRPGTIEEAGNYMGEDFMLPEYTASGFTLDLVQVPVNMSKEGMDIMLGYKSANKLYTLSMRKGATSLDYFVGDRTTDINGVTAQFTSGKQMAGSTEIAYSYTQMRWLGKNILYILEGQISEEEAIKVARSIR